MAGTTKRLLGAVSGLAVILAAGGFGYSYWTHGRYEIATDDAYVQADYTTVAPKVSGYVSEVAVEDNQPVRSGQVLARIDAAGYRPGVVPAPAGSLARPIRPYPAVRAASPAASATWIIDPD